MESLGYNFAMNEVRQPFTSSSEVTSTTEPLPTPVPSAPSSEAGFSASAPSFKPSSGDLLTLLAQQEPRPVEAMPSPTELDEMMMNFRLGGSEINFDDIDTNQNYFLGSNSNRTESVSSRNSLWNDLANAGPSSGRQTDQMATFDFLVKSVSAANTYISMLTREQVAVLQSLRPSLLFDFLQEVARVRTEKRSRRALPNECAFCKNNGENEECYSSHALKDWRGRVLCPVLRAFRCPRCGATGDRAHTIKYCPDNNDADRSGLSTRRRMQSSLSLGGSTMPTPLGPLTPTPQTAPPPSPSVHTPMSHNTVWSSFGMN